MTTTLLTKRLILVPYNADMVTQQHVDWLNDRAVVKYSEQRHVEHTTDTQVDYLRWLNRTNALAWLIRIKDADIGTIFANVDMPNQVADLGILIGHRPAWKRGYGFEAWSVTMEHLFSIGIRKVEAGCMADNAGMRAIMLKSSMSMEGCRFNHFLRDGVPEHMLLFGRKNPNG
jgi:RimJ/RimL family protein N-acetyltransferase